MPYHDDKMRLHDKQQPINHVFEKDTFLLNEL